jgi:hypothetical protein
VKACSPSQTTTKGSRDVQFSITVFTESKVSLSKKLTNRLWYCQFISVIGIILMTFVGQFNQTADLLMERLRTMADGKTSIKLFPEINHAILDAVNEMRRNHLK